MPKINTDVVLRNMLGGPLETPLAPGQKPEPLTLVTVLINCLINEADGEKLDAKGKIDRYDLALRVKNGGEVEFTSDEVTMCKESISKQFPVLVVGQAHRLLEGKETGLEIEPKKEK